jgi:NADPH:quinone reductase-like Zn-dependent oxidoreductase
MRAYVLKRTGGPEVLKISDIAEPGIPPNHIKIRLHYCGINYADILSRKGLYGWAPKGPFILGMEAMGTVEEVGENVEKNIIGKKVLIGNRGGCYAEKIVTEIENVVPAFSIYNDAENAAFLINYLTAWVGLMELAKVRKGEKVLVTAAAGGVGSAVVQIATALGAEVYGLVGSTEKISFVESCGALKGVNYNSGTYLDILKEQSSDYDVIVEMIGGNVFKDMFKLISPLGRLVVLGFASLDLKKWNPFSWLKTWRDIPRVKIESLARKSAAVMATHLGYLLADPEKLHHLFDDLNHFVMQNNIRPRIDKIFSFTEAPEAHRYIESRKSMGKVLLQIS